MKVRSEIPTAENTTNMDGFGTCEVGTTLENLPRVWLFAN